jgi:hypothetical protein
MERRPPFRLISPVTTMRFALLRPIVRIVTAAAVPTCAALLTCAAASGAHAQVVRRGLPGQRPDSVTQPRVATGTIDGFVGDTALAPLLSAEVKILSTNVRVNTGPSGRFRMTEVPVGQYVLIVRRAGYRPASALIQVGERDTLRLSYSLEREATSLAPAVVTARQVSLRMAEFDSRRRLGQGEFMTEEQIRQRNSVYTTELLRRFTTVNVSPSNTSTHGGMPDYYALSRRESGSIMSNAQQGYCPMAVYVDNVQMPTPFNLDLLPSPRWLAGIEVYNGPASTPPRFSGFDKGCGVILVWTKDGY